MVGKGFGSTVMCALNAKTTDHFGASGFLFFVTGSGFHSTLASSNCLSRHPRFSRPAILVRIMRLPFVAFFLMALPSFASSSLRLTSPDFATGASIPARFTCEGQNISPGLIIAGVPAGAQSLVLIVDDPDAPSGTFTHWLVWNIPPGTKKLPAGESPPGAIQGTNDFGAAGYSGPCPPSGTHRYFFRLSALNSTLHLASGASRKDLDAALGGHIVASAVLMGRYAKTGGR